MIQTMNHPRDIKATITTPTLLEVVEEEDSEEEGEAGEDTEVMEVDIEETNDQVMILMVLLVECDAWRILVMIMATVTEKVMVPAV